MVQKPHLPSVEALTGNDEHRLLTELKVRCAIERRSVSDAVATLVAAWLKRRRRQGSQDLPDFLVQEA